MQEVTKTAVVGESAHTPTYFYDSARDGMRDFLVRSCEGSATVLLPSYIGWSRNEGSGVFDPIADLGLDARFYRVGPDLSADVDDLESQLSEVERPIVVVIHYFGRTEPSLARIADVSRERGAILVEDSAHAFFSARWGNVAGGYGDVAMYSLHKMFPTPDRRGGMVTYRTRSLLAGQESTRPDLAGFVMDYDWTAIAERRRSNFTLLAQQLRELETHGQQFELMWADLAPTDVPQTLPVLIRNGSRDLIYHAMNAQGYGMVSLYHTLIPQLRDRLDMESLAQRVINFPVHQDVQREHLERMVAAFEVALRDGAGR